LSPQTHGGGRWQNGAEANSRLTISDFLSELV